MKIMSDPTLRIDSYVMHPDVQEAIFTLCTMLEADIRKQIKDIDDNTAKLATAQILNKFSMTIYEAASGKPDKKDIN